jgi:hypothetical protein
MPRPKSELTTTAKRIGAKLTTWQYEEWKHIFLLVLVTWRIKVVNR